MKTGIVSQPDALRVYLDNGQRVQLVDSKTLCRFLGVAKPETLLEMARRGDMPSPIHLNLHLKGQKGRNQIRWNLPAVLAHLGLEKFD